eukprot:RCo042251
MSFTEDEARVSSVELPGKPACEVWAGAPGNTVFSGALRSSDVYNAAAKEEEEDANEEADGAGDGVLSGRDWAREPEANESSTVKGKLSTSVAEEKAEVETEAEVEVSFGASKGGSDFSATVLCRLVAGSTFSSSSTSLTMY